MKEKSIKRLFFALTFMSLFLPVLCFAGTAYYVDPKAPGGGTGTFEKPWNGIAQVNAKVFANGDDVYFKAGTVMNVTEQLLVKWHGTKNDPVVIGAYYGKGQFGLGGKPRPIFDGQKIYPKNMYQFVVQHSGPGYVIVENLHIKNSYGGGINTGEIYYPDSRYSVGNIIRNNIVEQSGRQAICLSRCSDSIVDNNNVDTASLTIEWLAAGMFRYGGAGIEVTGFKNEAGGRNIIRGNVVRGCNESIGIYQGEKNTIAENNVVFDVSQVAIYGANSRSNIMRNNVVYMCDPVKSLNWRQPERGRGVGLWIDCENNHTESIKVTGDWQIHGNYIAGFKTGVWIQSSSNAIGVYQTNNKVHDNVIVDCDRNIWVHQAVEGWEKNEIYDNYSFILSPGLVHVQTESPIGVTWYRNHFNTAAVSAPGGNAAWQAIFNNPGLIKTTGWRDLPVDGSVTAAAFAFTSAEKSGHSVESVSELKIR